MRKIEIFDTTLRDGMQGESISFSVDDKLRIVRILDDLGVDYIEAGNPGSNPKDQEFFVRAHKLKLSHARLVAFGSTRRKNTLPQNDPALLQLLDAGTQTVTIFGKSSPTHVTSVLGTTLNENLAMIRDSVSYACERGRTVIYDAEHFFDGYKEDAGYALQTLHAAHEAGASTLVLCDTNGGCFPHEITAIIGKVQQRLDCDLGVHTHDDTGCAVASSIEAVLAGAVQVQGTFLGFGERTGNANLSAVIPSLQLKLGFDCIPTDRMHLLTKAARQIAEVSNTILPHNLPYVGSGAFTHKGGMHIDGVSKFASSFEHIDPSLVGNKRHKLLSEMAGRGALLDYIGEVRSDLTKDSPEVTALIDLIKQREFEGFSYESAEASLELLTLKQLKMWEPFFTLSHFRILGEQPQGGEPLASALVKVVVDAKEEITAAEGDGPVHALDCALRKALEVFYPSLADVRLVDFKVRVVEPQSATAAVVRVLIESTDGYDHWTTVGASSDIIYASFVALADSIEYKLYKDRGRIGV